MVKPQILLTFGKGSMIVERPKGSGAHFGTRKGAQFRTQEGTQTRTRKGTQFGTQKDNPVNGRDFVSSEGLL